MRILHINKSDAVGGASVAATRLVESLNKSGVDAKMLVAEKKTNLPCVETITSSQYNKIRAWLYHKLEISRFIPHGKSNTLKHSYSIGEYGFDISKHPAVKEADIIHLHWFGEGFVSLKGLDKILKLGKPVVWTLHNMWSFTGGCLYSGECKRFTENCGLCKYLMDSASDDISFAQHNCKKQIYSNSRFFPVACSNWLAKIAEQSTLLKGKHVISIPNLIDIDSFKPINRIEVRERLNLPKDKKLILFGAADVSDPRKGMPHLFFALKLLAKRKYKDNMELIVFGKAPETLANELPFPVRIMNYISSPEVLVDLYNAADVFVLPSLEDNLPNTVMEALSCGLPVAAFRVGGVPEMITHGYSGYLTPPSDGTGLAEGIEYLLEKSESRNCRAIAREKVEESFAPSLIAERYILLYNEILERIR